MPVEVTVVAGTAARHGDVPLPAGFAPHVGDDGPHSGVVFGLRRVVDAVYGAARREWFDHLVHQVGDVVDDERQGGCPIQAFRRQVVDQWRACTRLPGQLMGKAIIVEAAVAGAEAAAMAQGRAGGVEPKVPKTTEGKLAARPGAKKRAEH